MARCEIDRGYISGSPQEFVAEMDKRAFFIHNRVRQVDVDDKALDGGTDRLKDPSPNLKTTADRSSILVDEE